MVEDQQDTRQVPTGLLRRWGYDVFPADSLKSGVDRLETEPPIDVILSDIGLRDGTGSRWSAKRAVAGNGSWPSPCPATPIRAMSGSPSSPASITTYRNRAIVTTSAQSYKTARGGQRS